MADDNRIEEIRQRNEAFKRGAEYRVCDHHTDVDYLLSEIDRLKGKDVEAALAELREMTAMDRIEVLSHVDSGFKIVGMRDGNRLIDTGWWDTFELAMAAVRAWKSAQDANIAMSNESATEEWEGQKLADELEYREWKESNEQL